MRGTRKETLEREGESFQELSRIVCLGAVREVAAL